MRERERGASIKTSFKNVSKYVLNFERVIRQVEKSLKEGESGLQAQLKRLLIAFVLTSTSSLNHLRTIVLSGGPYL